MLIIKKVSFLIALLTGALFLYCSPTIPVETPDDLERASVWQYLKVYSIYQENILADPFEYGSIQSMLDMLGDTLKGFHYTCFVDSNYQNISYPYSFLHKRASDTKVTFDSLTDSSCVIKIGTFMDYDYESSTVLDQFKGILSKVANFKKVIIDLRQNTGGNLETTDSITQMILPAGIKYIHSKERVYDKSTKKAKTSEFDWETTRGQAPAFRNKQFAVLIDGMTASASEILALALKDGMNAPMFGTRSYGKGIGQVFIERTNRPWIKITFMHIYRLKEPIDYHHVGIEPDSVSSDLRLSGVSVSDKPLYYAIKNLQPSAQKNEISYPLYKNSSTNPLAKDIGMYRIVKDTDIDTGK